MNLRQKAKKLKKENEILKKRPIPTIIRQLDGFDTVRTARIMMSEEIPIEEYKHQVALDIGNYLYLNNYIDWEMLEDIPLKKNKIIGTIRVAKK